MKITTEIEYAVYTTPEQTLLDLEAIGVTDATYYKDEPGIEVYYNNHLTELRANEGLVIFAGVPIVLDIDVLEQLTGDRI